jgi:hypothetical protein
MYAARTARSPAAAGSASGAEVAFAATVGHDAHMTGQVLDARRALLAVGGFIGGVLLTKAFGLVGFIALLVLFVVGIPLLAVLSAKRAARPSKKL